MQIVHSDAKYSLPGQYHIIANPFQDIQMGALACIIGAQTMGGGGRGGWT